METSTPINVNWEDTALKRWLDPITKPNTKAIYRSAIKTYIKYTGLTASQLIDEALEDQAKDIRQRRGIALNRIISFYQYLKKDYIVKSRGAGEHVEVKRGLSDKGADLYISAVRSFYSLYDITVRLKGRTRLPRPKVANKRMRLGAEQVKRLVDNARTPRDRAIILTLFQGGLDVSTLCSIKYGDAKEALAKGELPVKLELTRPKTDIEFYTFLGRDAAEALKLYIKDAERRGAQFTEKTPLFLKERSRGEPMIPNNIQDILKETAVKAGLIDEKNNGHDFNIAGPHALRESFGSIMINSGVPDTIVDFWLGHAIGEMAEAYKGVQFESVRKMYLERERLISISQPPVDLGELDKKVDAKVDERIQSLQRVISNYATDNLALKTENLELKARMAKVELAVTELKKELEKLLG